MNIAKLFWVVCYSVIGWMFIVPLNYLIPRRKNIVLFIGKGKGFFADNVKYMLIHVLDLRPADVSTYFLTSDKKTARELKGQNVPVLEFPSWKAYPLLFKAGVVVSDSPKWLHEWKYFFLHTAIKVQLWHGIGFKQMETGKLKLNKTSTFKQVFTYLFILLRYEKESRKIYDLFCGTSKFYIENTFSKFIRAKEYVNFGHPRTDILINHSINGLPLIGADKTIIQDIQRLRGKGEKIVLYAPTFRKFRDDLSDVWGDLNLDQIKDFAAQNNLIFVLKFHPNTKVANHPLLAMDDMQKHQRVFIYDKDADIYPLLPYVDALITDYSSIFMDYLLLDRPVFFYCFDYKKYIEEEKETQFDYSWITPGPKCHNFVELKKELVRALVHGHDDFKEKRKEIVDVAFDHKDGCSASRIWKFMKDKYIQPHRQ